MSLQDFLNSLNRDQLQKLAEAQNAGALLKKAHDMGLTLSEDEAAAAFAALYPARGGKLNDDALERVSGGVQPDPTIAVLHHPGDTEWGQIKVPDHL